MRRGGRLGAAIPLAVLAAALLAVGLTGCGGAPTGPAGEADTPAVDADSQAARPVPPPAAPRKIPIEVAYGETVELELARGDCHELELELEPGRYLEMTIEQRGLDVATMLAAPSGGEALLFDAPTGRSGFERLAYVAGSAGLHEVEICAFETGGPEPSYHLHVASPRIPTERDRAMARGLLRYADGERRATEGDSAAAATAFREALVAFGDAGAGPQRGWTHYWLGRLAERAGDPMAAEDHYVASAAIHRELGEQRQEAFALTFLHQLLVGQLRLREAREVDRRALQLAEGADDPLLLVGALWNLALAHESLGETLQAVELYRRRRALAAEIGDTAAEWGALSRIGKVYRIGGDQESAQPFFEEALALARRHRLDEEVVESLQDLGRVHLDREEPLVALRYFERALDRMTASGPSEERATLLNNMGRAHRRLGNRAQSLELFDQALAALPAAAGKPRILEGLILVNLASLYILEGDFEAAEAPSERALAIYRAAGQPLFTTGALKCIAEVRAAQGELQEAASYLEELLEIVETRRSRSALSELRATLLEEKHFYYEFSVEVLHRLHERYPDAGYAARAFEIAERARARLLLDELAGTEAAIVANADPEAVAAQREIEARMSDLESRLLKERLDAGEDEALRRRLQGLSTEHAFTTARIFADYPGWSALLQSEPMTLEAIRSELLADGRTQLVSVFLGEDLGFAWVVGRDSLELEVLPGTDRLDSFARAAADNLRRSEQPHLEAQARLAAETLSRELLVPMIRHLRARKLILIKDSGLHYVPFAALPIPTAGRTGTSAGELLIDRFEIVEVPSASAAVALRDRRSSIRAGVRELAVLADPVFEAADERLLQAGRLAAPRTASAGARSRSSSPVTRGLGGLQRLRGTREEARRISALLPRDRRLVALDFKANRDLLLGGKLSGYRILHLAGHGLAHPELTGLVLSLYDSDGRPIDGLIRPYEIYGTRLSAELVVLSACSTGLGSEVRGEGLLGLSRGFLYAGASQVLASLWDVDDGATAELMERFYTALLRDGDPPARALRKAQLSLRRDPAWAAPHYWAGFVLQGDGR